MNETLLDEAASDKPRRKLGFLANLSIFGVALLVCLLVGEFLARTIFSSAVIFPRYHAAVDYGDYTLRRTRPDTDFWHTSLDGSWEFRINQQGFRDDSDYRYEKAEDTLRIMTLGDSNTEGYEVEQEASFSEVIERYLGQRNIRAEVLNTGVSGFGTAEMLAFFENEGLRYKPDIVVLGFFANDYEDSVKSGLFALEEGRLVNRSYENTPGTGILAVVNEIAPLRWLSENSYLYSVTMNTAWLAAKTIAARAADEAVKLEYAVPSEELTDYKRDLIIALVRRLKASVESIGARLVIVDIPVTSNWKEAVRDGKRNGNLTGSIPDDQYRDFTDISHSFLSTEELFSDYREILIIHRQQGHYHITEPAHAIIGIEVAKDILEGLTEDSADRFRLN